jgi:hypothetical protein
LNGNRKGKPGKWKFLAGVCSILLLFACFGLVGGGVVRVSNNDGHRIVGMVMVCAGILLAAATIEQWARILPGVFGVAGLNALAELFSGHRVNHPSIVTSRTFALTFVIVLFSAAALSVPVSTAKFTGVHRILLPVVFVLLVLQILSDRFAIAAALGMLCCLCILWRVSRANHVGSHGSREHDCE